MITTFIAWIYIFFITSVYGLIILHLLSRIKITENSEEVLLRPDLVSLSGFGILTVVLAWTSLLYPIGWQVHLFILVVASLYTVLYTNRIQKYFRGIFKALINQGQDRSFYILILFLVLICAILPDYQFDTGYYHAQIIQWIEKYKVVPGLGNLSPVLAYNQSVYLTSALFSFSFLSIPPMHVVNSYLFLLLMLRLLYEIFNTRKYNIIYFGLFMYFIMSRYTSVVSTGTDLPAFILVAYVVILFMKNEKNHILTETFLILLYGFTVCTIKMSAFPVILLILLFIILNFKYYNFRQLGILTFTFLLFLTPWIIRNIMLSGYLVYPFTLIDIFNVDWKIPLQDVHIQKDYIKSCAFVPVELGEALEEIRQNTFQGLLHGENGFNQEFYKLTFIEKLHSLLRHRMTILQFLTILFSLGTILNGPFLIKKNKEKNDKTIIYLWIFSYLAILFWFLMAPHFRMGGFYLNLLLYSGLYILFYHIGLKFINKLVKFFEDFNILIAKIFIIGFLAFLLVFNLRDISNQLVFQPSYKDIETVSVSENYPGLITPENIDEDYFRCWNEPVPCIPTAADTIGFEFRSGNIQDGFRPRKR